MINDKTNIKADVVVIGAAQAESTIKGERKDA